MYRIRQALARFFMGRRGMDELGIAIYIGGFVLYIVSLIFNLGIVNLLATAMWIYGIYRMLSKNLYKREQENNAFMAKYTPVRRKATQAHNRFKNRKVYKYFKCPKCHSWLKLPRGIGEKTVICGKCGESIRKKA